MHEHIKGKPIALPCREIGQYLGIEKGKVSWGIRRLLELEVLHLAARHDWPGRRAARYWYDWQNDLILPPL